MAYTYSGTQTVEDALDAEDSRWEDRTRLTTLTPAEEAEVRRRVRAMREYADRLLLEAEASLGLRRAPARYGDDETLRQAARREAQARYRAKNREAIRERNRRYHAKRKEAA